MPLPRLNTARAFLTGWTRRKKFTVSATAANRNRILNMLVYNTSGTDTDSTVYLGGNIRSDWGDLRITKEDGVTCIPFAILRREATFIEIAIRMDVRNGNTYYYIYYDGPAADVYKIAHITDVHYDTITYADRDQAVAYIGNFNTRMAAYQPDLAVNGGDKTGANSSVEATQLGLYQDVLDEFALTTATTKRDGVAPGNHDFEYMSFANVLAKHSGETWMESGVMYGKWETTYFLFISLDANYSPGTDTHLSIAHNGYGYINPAQAAWLSDTLEAATKDVIIFCHQPLSEMDTDQFTLSKEIYHTQNRKEIRSILESSQKVVAVIHGHVHKHRIDVIRGIPYITCGNLTNDDSFGEVPFAADGGWELLEFDRSSRVIRAIRETYISSAYETVYESYVPFGKTIFSTDISDNPEEVFSLNFNGGFNRSAFIRDPVQLTVLNDDHLYKFPVNLHTPDDSTMIGGIRINGRTDSPNFGRAIWILPNVSEKFIFEGWVLMGDQKFKGIKIGGRDTTNNPRVYITFDTDGNVKAASNTGTLTTLGAYSLGTWYKMEIFIDPDAGGYAGMIGPYTFGNPAQYGFYVAGTDLAMREMEIATETGDMWIHSFSIKPWFSPRPELDGFSAEETS